MGVFGWCIDCCMALHCIESGRRDGMEWDGVALAFVAWLVHLVLLMDWYGVWISSCNERVDIDAGLVDISVWSCVFIGN